MDGSLINNLLKMDMLNRGKKNIFYVIVLPILFCCCETKQNKNDPYIISSNTSGDIQYKKTLQKANDSIVVFHLNNLKSYNFLNSGIWYLDSLICFNANKSRFIGCVLYTTSNFKLSDHDGIQFFYGEKIDTNWYFFKGENVHVPREMVKNQPIDKPLSYQQLHQIALREVYKGYLKRDGDINEDWFTEHFEGSGYGDFNDQTSFDWFLKGKRFKIKKDFYEFVHLEKVRNNWGSINRDSIRRLPLKSDLP